MTIRRVTIYEMVETVYMVEIDTEDGQHQEMAVDLITNNADDEEFMASVIQEERLIGKKFLVERVSAKEL